MTLYLCGLMLSFFMCYKLNFYHDRTEASKISRAIITAFTWPLVFIITVATIAIIYLCIFLDKASDLLADVIEEFT